MKKIMLVFGTRPEAIKMCPLVNELKTRSSLSTIVCVTAQHRQMLDQVLETFDVVPDYDLNIMKDRQTLFDITTNILGDIKGVLVAVLLSSEKLEARIYSDSAVKTIISGVLFILIFIKGKKFYSKEWWKYALAFNLPLIPHFLANYALSQSDRLMIGRMVGSSEAGYYSIAYTISMMMFLIVNAINNAIEPYLYRSLDSKDIKNVAKRTNPLIILIGVMTVMVMAFAPEVIYVFAGVKYMDAINVIPPISVAVFFIYVYSLYSTVEYFYQKTSFIAIATTISALINLVLNYFGIRIFGYYAAGYTTLICYMLLTLLHYCFYKRILKHSNLGTSDIYSLKVILIVGMVLLGIMVLMALTYSQIIIR